ncbi:MAG: hypothetical protein DMG30_03075 [Acidobacteria bacterium]|nr:MAG: hypothetical protein DMG30_03075 [Acidobacteriota bacterium]
MRCRATRWAQTAFGGSLRQFIAPTTVVRGIESVGGWLQLKFKPKANLGLNGAFGQENPFARDLRQYPGNVSYFGLLISRNQSELGNFIYHLEPGLRRPGRAMQAMIANASLCLGLAVICAYAQQSSVVAQVEVVRQGGGERRKGEAGFADLVVWLMPMDAPPTSDPVSSTPRIVQRNKNKMFEPHVLAVRVGSAVEFPNQDPFLHNVLAIRWQAI